eukprot:NODE_897_length_3216_cov_0.988450.p2 type:complete len:135 gc:universal NODE_897_length_3216_cov_0.988450:613-1017(+)
MGLVSPNQIFLSIYFGMAAVYFYQMSMYLEAYIQLLSGIFSASNAFKVELKMCAFAVFTISTLKLIMRIQNIQYLNIYECWQLDAPLGQELFGYLISILYNMCLVLNYADFASVILTPTVYSLVINQLIQKQIQ